MAKKKKTSSLMRHVDAFLKSNPRRNPPGDDVETRFDKFILEMKSQGHPTDKWGESEWYEAAIKFGFDEDDATMALEQVAAWGVDD